MPLVQQTLSGQGAFQHYVGQTLIRELEVAQVNKSLKLEQRILRRRNLEARVREIAKLDLPEKLPIDLDPEFLDEYDQVTAAVLGQSNLLKNRFSDQQKYYEAVIQKLQENLDQLESKYAANLDEVHNAREDSRTTQAKLDTALGDVKRLDKESNEHRQKIGELQAENSNQQTKIKELEQRNVTSQEEAARELRHAHDDRDNKLSSKNEQISIRDKQLMENADKIQDLEAQLQLKQQEVTTLKDNLQALKTSSSQDVINTIRATLEVELELSAEKGRHQEARAEVRMLKNSLRDTEARESSLKQEVSDKNDELRAKDTDMQSREQWLQKKLDEKEDAVNEASAKHQAYLSKTKDEARTKEKDHASEISRLQDELRAESNKQHKTFNDLIDTKNRESQAKVSLEVVKARLEEVNKRTTVLEGYVADAQSKADNAQSDNKSLRQQNVNLTGEVKQHQKQYRQLKQDYTTLFNDVDRANKDIDYAQANMDLARHEHDEFFQAVRRQVQASKRPRALIKLGERKFFDSEPEQAILEAIHTLVLKYNELKFAAARLDDKAANLEHMYDMATRVLNTVARRLVDLRDITHDICSARIEWRTLDFTQPQLDALTGLAMDKFVEVMDAFNAGSNRFYQVMPRMKPKDWDEDEEDLYEATR